MVLMCITIYFVLDSTIPGDVSYDPVIHSSRIRTMD
jgi:hypothetical protein